MTRTIRTALLCAAFATLPAVALAHPGHGPESGFAAGFVLATALLHGLGIATGLLIARRLAPVRSR